MRNNAIASLAVWLAGCLLISSGLMRCAGSRMSGKVPANLGRLLSTADIKVIGANTSRFPQISAKVVIRDTANLPITNLAPPYGHLDDWQMIWKPLVENHPLLGADSLLEFKVVEFQPELPLQKEVARQKVSLAPYVVLVLDISGSMAGEPLTKAKEAALKFVNHADSEIAIIAFNDAAKLKNGFTNDRSVLSQSISTLASSGGTHLYDALYEAIELIQGKSGERHIIALTDGATGGDRYTLEEIINLANSGDVNITAQTGTGAKIFSIGLGYHGQNLAVLSERTGGVYHFVETPDQLVDIFESLSEGLKARFYYLLSYQTPFPIADGTERELRIKLVSNIVDGNFRAPLSTTRFQLSGYVSDEETGERIPAARITIKPHEVDSTFSAIADSTGRYRVVAMRTNQRASIFVDGPDHFIAVIDTVLTASGKYYLEKDFTLKRIKPEVRVAMRTIHFETNEYLFEPVSIPDLMIIAKYLLKHPEIRFQISGHTDSYGNADYNQWLSEKRAESVRDFFVSVGIPEQNISWTGYGESQRLFPDDSAEHRYMNRRVEIKILEVLTHE